MRRLQIDSRYVDIIVLYSIHIEYPILTVLWATGGQHSGSRTERDSREPHTRRSIGAESLDTLEPIRQDLVAVVPREVSWMDSLHPLFVRVQRL